MSDLMLLPESRRVERNIDCWNSTDSNHRFSWLVIDFVQVRVSWDDYVHFFPLICSQQPDSMIQYHGNVRQANIKLSNTDKYWWEREEIERGFQTIQTDNPPDLIRLETYTLFTVSAAIFHKIHRLNGDNSWILVHSEFNMSVLHIHITFP